ncbi:MAG: hypothetical protein J6Z49_05500 [Kiritimatiellae bacterium]|nr:hypothetical protein [Kiritimatiellia bacterium]
MSDSAEDFASEILGKIAGFALVVFGISWLVKWIWGKIVSFMSELVGVFTQLFRFVSESYSNNTSLVWSIIAAIVGVGLFIKLIKSVLQLRCEQKKFLASVTPSLKSLEYVVLQAKSLEESEWESWIVQMEKNLTDVGA